MKALTIRQPWASLIAAGVKTIETRSQRTHHRGPLAIHAGLHRPVEGEDVGDWWWCWDVDQGVIVRQRKWAQHPAPLGAIVAVVNVVDCLPVHDTGTEPIPDDLIYQTVDGRALFRQTVVGDPSYSENVHQHDITDQLPYGDFSLDRWGHIYADVRPLPEPVPCRGAQGLWNVPDDVEAAVLAQLREQVPA